MDRGRAFLYLLLAVVALAVFLIVLPFLEYILLALVFAYVLYPIHVRVDAVLAEVTPIDRIAGPLSALLVIVGAILAIIVPMFYVLTVFMRDLQALARGDIELETAVIEAELGRLLGVELAIDEALILAGEWVFSVFFGDVPGLLFVVLQVSLGVALVLFLVFYLLLEGPALVRWLIQASPISAEVSATLIEQIDRTTWGAVIGHSFAAVVQGIVAGVGLYLAGIPNVMFWTIVMIILAFLPLIGVFLIWAPAAGYLYLIGETGAAMLLALYGLTVVSFIDYYARPIMIDQRARLNPAVILVGVFGGIFTLGFVGLFVGPILIGVLVAILETFRREYGTPPSVA